MIKQHKVSQTHTDVRTAIARSDQCRQKLETALQANANILDSAVLERTNCRGDVELVAYALLAEGWTAPQFAAQLMALAPPGGPACTGVAVAQIALTASGGIDLQALATLPVIDGDSAERWKEALVERHEIGESEVAMGSVAASPRRLHRSSLPLTPAQTGLVNGEPVTLDALPPSPVGEPTVTASYLDGGVLAETLDAPADLPGLLRRAAALALGPRIVYVDADGTGQVASYADLLGQAESILAGLRECGLKAGDKAILQLARNDDILPAFWGCVLGGIVPVVMAPPPSYREANHELERLRHVIALLEPAAMVVERSRHTAASALPLGTGQLLALEDLRQCPKDARHHAPQPGDAAFFSLSSGSTGAPKAIALTHRNLISRARGTNFLNRHAEDDVILNWLPFDHIGSISDWHIRCVELGCTLVYAPKEYVLGRPLNWLDMLHRHRVSHSWAANFAYALILDALKHQSGESGWDLSCVKALLSAGEAVAPAIVEAFVSALSGFGFSRHAIRPAFGMAEMGSGVTYFQAGSDHPLRFHSVSRASLGGAVVMSPPGDPAAVSFTNLGPPIPGICLRIVDADDHVVPFGTVGRFQVKGDAVSPGYYRNPEANAAAFLEGGWFDTGDLGFFTEGGLVLTGRAKDTLIVNGANFAAVEIEAAAESVPGIAVSYTAACAVRMPGREREDLAVFFAPEDPGLGGADLAVLLHKLAASMVKTLGIQPDYWVPVASAQIPKTAIGKIQRKALGLAMEIGEFDAAWKQADVLLCNERSLPDWFYRKAWRRRDAVRIMPRPDPSALPVTPLFQPGVSGGEPPGLALIFADRLGLADVLERALAAAGKTCVRVGQAENYQQQLQSLAGQGRPLAEIWHLLDYAPIAGEPADESALAVGQATGAASLLSLAQVLARQSPPMATLRLFVVASHVQALASGESVAYAKAPVPALLKSLAAELPWLDCRHIDLDPVDGAATNFKCLWAERASTGAEIETAWRGGERWVARLEKIQFEPQITPAAAFQRAGVYLLTGGLGGLGVEVAAFLLERYAARVVLLGQTELPVECTDAGDAKSAVRLYALRRLCALGGEVLYRAADVGDPVALRRIVAEAEAHWQAPLSGVFHLAGVARECALADESPQEFFATLRPKQAGALAVGQLFKDRPRAFAVLFSSVAGHFGGAMLGAYASANAFLDAYARHLQTQGMRCVSLAWTPWDGVGMGKDAPAAVLEAKGFHTMALADGLASLQLGLALSDAHLLVGLDGGKPQVARHRVDGVVTTQALTAYVTVTQRPLRLSLLRSLAIADRFGQPLPCRIEVVETIPRLPDGKPDFEALRRSSTDGGPDYLAPRTGTESRLAEIWQEVLGLAKIGVLDNFFALGGASLKATQSIVRANQSFGLELAPNALFEHPSLEALAAHIETRLGHPSPSGGLNIPKRGSEDPTELSYAQEQLWFLHQLNPRDVSYNVCVCLRITGGVDAQILGQAVNAVVQRHESLRMTFHDLDGRPVQSIVPELNIPLRQTDLRDLPLEQQDEAGREWFRRETAEPFDLSAGPLLRTRLLQLAGGEALLLLTVHHIVFDGWSCGVLISELGQACQALSQGLDPPLPPLALQYADFACWQRQALAAKLDGQLEYWRRRLADAPPLLDMPTDRPRPPVLSYAGGSLQTRLDGAFTARLKSFAQSAGATLHRVLLAGYAALLQRYSGQDDLTVATPSANRNHADLEPLIGYFVNTLALRVDFSASPGFAGLLEQLRHTTVEAYAHAEVSYSRVVDALGLVRHPGHMPLCQTLFVLQDIPLHSSDWPQASLHLLPSTTAGFDLVLEVWQDGPGLLLKWEYRADLFKPSTIERLAGHFHNLLHAALEQPETCTQQLAMLSASERKQILVEWNDTAVDFPHGLLAHQRVESRAGLAPDAPAVVDGELSLSYGELNLRANQLAHYLQAQGIGPERLVAVCAERSIELIVALLGVFKAGGAYLPLDPDYPAERLGFMLDDSQASLLLTVESALAGPLGEAVAGRSCLPVRLDDTGAFAGYPGHNPTAGNTAASLAYVIYTSGSTGTPKGVMIEQGSLANLIDGHHRLFDIQASDRALVTAGVGFDASVFEIWPCLCAGAALYPAAAEDIASGRGLRERIDAQHITYAFLVTPLLEAVLPDIASAHSLRTLIAGGDTLHGYLPEDSPIRLFNCYGPTENTVVSTVCQLDLTMADEFACPSIGSPFDNTRVYLLGPGNQPVPVGVRGELCVVGAGLARGYLNRPELTAEKFVGIDIDGKIERVYRTGDLARWHEDGNLEFLGRIDHQVKIRGFRIELGEIETALDLHPAVDKALVLVYEPQGHKRLVAYFTAAGPVTAQDLRDLLAATLPDYMVPGVFIALKSFPLTANGKIDRRALSVPEDRHFLSDTEYVAPASPVEQQLADIWASVLGCARVGLDDNFFALGGDSILSLQVVARARQQGLRILPGQLFEHQTVAQLARVAKPAETRPSEQGLVQGEVPLLPIQHWFFEQNRADVDQFNLTMWSEIEGPVDPSLLAQALRQVENHHDALRHRFHYDGAAWRQESSPLSDDAPFERVDLSREPSPEALWLAVRNRLQASLDLATGPVMRMALFVFGEGMPSRLFWTVHHLVVDGVSWRILLEDLQTAYRQLLRGEAVRLSAKTTSCQAWARWLAEQGPRRLAGEIAHWQAACLATGAALPRDYPALDSANTVASQARITTALSVEDTRLLLGDAHLAYHTQANDLLLAALLRVFAEWTGQPGLLVDLEGHGREDIAPRDGEAPDEFDLSRTVGWFTSLFPVYLRGGQGEESGALIKSVKEQLRAVPNRGVGYGVLRYLSHQNPFASGPKAEVSFNYLGQFDSRATGQAEPFSLNPEFDLESAMHSPRQRRGYSIEVNSVVADGQLRVDWAYSGGIHDPSTIVKLADYYIAALRGLLAHCQAPETGGFTPSDFPDAGLSQEELDDLLLELDEA